MGKAIWEFYAYCYDSLLFFRPYKKLTSQLIKELELKKGEIVVDLGSGTGNLEKLTSEEVQFYGFDLSEEMTRRARKKNLNHNFEIYDLSANKIPLKDSFADKVVSCNVVYNLKDLYSFFADVKRIMKEDALFVFTTSTNSGLLPVIKGHFRNINLNEFVKFILRLPQFIIVLLINIIIDKSNNYIFYSKEEIEKYLNKSGLKLIKTLPSYEGINTLFVAKKV